mgnify:CR=1 FL=1
MIDVRGKGRDRNALIEVTSVTISLGMAYDNYSWFLTFDQIG